MSVLIFDDDNKISVPVASERYFNSVWEKAINELNLHYIGNGKYINLHDLTEILEEFLKVRVWAKENLSGCDKDYVVDRINYILEYLPKCWNENDDIKQLYMG